MNIPFSLDTETESFMSTSCSFNNFSLASQAFPACWIDDPTNVGDQGTSVL